MAWIGHQYNLITYEEARTFVDIASPDSQQESLINMLTTGVSQMLETYCSRKFKSRDYTNEYHDGEGDVYMLTDEFPINSVASLYDDVDRLFDSNSLIDSTDYVIYKDIGKIQLINGSTTVFANGIFSTGEQNVKITYNAGYDAIPYDLKLIAGEVLSKKFKAFRDRRFGMSTLTSAGENMSIELKDILPDHRMILNVKYRKRR